MTAVHILLAVLCLVVSSALAGVMISYESARTGLTLVINLFLLLLNFGMVLANLYFIFPPVK